MTWTDFLPSLVKCVWGQQPHPAGVLWKPGGGQSEFETGVCVHSNESVLHARRFSSGEGREGKL